MAETQRPNYLVQKELGCGFVGAIFHRGGSRKTAEAPPLPAIKRGGEKPKKKPTYINPRPKTRSLIPSSSSSKVTNFSSSRRLTREHTFTESELSMKVSVRRIASESGTLYRASSSNVMVLGHLGNLKQTGGPNGAKTPSPASVKALPAPPPKENAPVIMGNIYRGGSCSMKRLGPEVLKNMGNEKYKKGRFEDAIVLYDQAIALDCNNASYYSNKSAALIGLGRLIEAVFECRVALRIEPCYIRAHFRLAKLYHRLGEAERALWHYKQCGTKIENKEIAQVQDLKLHLNRCTQARKVKDWDTLLKETQSVLSSGADSAPQVYALQSEALLNLHRHQEAYFTIQKGPNFDINYFTRLFGSVASSNLLTIRAQAYAAAGRFEEAVTAAHCAAKIDSSNEVNLVVKRIRALALARANGNHLYKASKFLDACIIYSEGLEQEPHNSVLLCNRAACRSKLGQFEKAVEDCTAALNLRPCYTKARLRRADCYSKLERWEAAVQDYEVLIQEMTGDEEVIRALCEARIQLRKQRS
ncbi:hypothetical protein LguiA_004163 [Lonicera macranthoides]